MREDGARLDWVALAIAAALLAALLVACSDGGDGAGAQSIGLAPASGPAPAVGCDRVAAPSGKDPNAGTVASPWRTPQHLADGLGPGQTGCFRGGLFVFDELQVTRPGVTLTSYPGERATLRGHIWVTERAPAVTVSHLNLDGRSTATPWGPRITAADTLFQGNDVTNHRTEICFLLGAGPSGRHAVRTFIEGNRIHDCGTLPSTNKEHGIYVAHAEDAVIRNNWIHDNADRGIQLYPDSQGTRVYGNVIANNGEGISIAGDGETASSDNLVYDNVIYGSTIRWNVESNWPRGLVGTRNVVRENCLWATNPRRYYVQDGGLIEQQEGQGRGFRSWANLIADPDFVNPVDGDFRIQVTSPCTTAP